MTRKLLLLFVLLCSSSCTLLPETYPIVQGDLHTFKRFDGSIVSCLAPPSHILELTANRKVAANSATPIGSLELYYDNLKKLVRKDLPNEFYVEGYAHYEACLAYANGKYSMDEWRDFEKIIGEKGKNNADNLNDTVSQENKIDNTNQNNKVNNVIIEDDHKESGADKEPSNKVVTETRADKKVSNDTINNIKVSGDVESNTEIIDSDASKFEEDSLVEFGKVVVVYDDEEQKKIAELIQSELQNNYNDIDVCIEECNVNTYKMSYVNVMSSEDPIKFTLYFGFTESDAVVMSSNAEMWKRRESFNNTSAIIIVNRRNVTGWIEKLFDKKFSCRVPLWPISVLRYDEQLEDVLWEQGINGRFYTNIHNMTWTDKGRVCAELDSANLPEGYCRVMIQREHNKMIAEFVTLCVSLGSCTTKNRMGCMVNYPGDSNKRLYYHENEMSLGN